MITGRRYEESVSVMDLIPHERNPREGNISVIADSIGSNGFYKAIVVHEGTKRILAGNHSYKAAVKLGHRTVPVIWVTCDDETAKRILVVDNRSADLGDYDDTSLVSLLRELHVTESGLSGTGYQLTDLESLVSKLQEGLLPPEDFREVSDEDIETEHRCPKCGYEWSGKAKASKKS